MIVLRMEGLSGIMYAWCVDVLRVYISPSKINNRSTSHLINERIIKHARKRYHNQDL